MANSTLVNSSDLGAVKWTEENILGAKNLGGPLYLTTKLSDHISFTLNDDQTISVSGQKTEGSPTRCRVFSMVYLPIGTYTLSGCPTGGSTSTYFLQFIYTDGNGDDTTINDIGAGGTLEVDDEDKYLVCIINIVDKTEYNLTFKPMVRLSSIVDDTYAPFSMINRTLSNDDLVLKKEALQFGSVNIIDFNTYDLGRAIPVAVDDKTFTIRPTQDGTFMISGTKPVTTPVFYKIGDFGTLVTEYAVLNLKYLKIAITTAGITGSVYFALKDTNGTITKITDNNGVDLEVKFGDSSFMYLEYGIYIDTMTGSGSVSGSIYPIICDLDVYNSMVVPFSNGYKEGAKNNYALTTQLRSLAIRSATNIAPREYNPATSAHSVGDHFMLDGVRYRATAAIAIGDTISSSNSTTASIESDTTMGHELVNASGSTMTQRSKMSFPDSHLTDDSGNNQTIVDIVKEVTTAQWNNATEEGLYYINDKPDSIITAEQVAYDDDNSVKDMIDGIELKIEQVSVTVPASSTPYSDVDKTLDAVTGYNPVGIVGYALNDQNKILIKGYVSAGHLLVTIGTKQTTVYSGSVTFFILYAKNKIKVTGV